MYGYIYITTNLINNKKYIGKHVAKQFEPDIYIGSGKYFQYAVEKYGEENFKCELLEWCETPEHLNLREQYWIDFYNAVESENYYNIGKGGDGFSHKGHISIVKDNVQKFIPIEEIDSYIVLGWEQKGLTPSRETIEKRVNGMKGKKHPTAGANISKAIIGIKRNEVTKEKMRLKKIGISSSAKGTIYIVKDNNVKRIKPEDFPYYESMGYIKGRTKLSEEIKDNISRGKSKTIGITNGKEYHYIKLEELEKFESQGYVKGHKGRGSTINKIHINNGKENTMCYLEELPYYKSQGYVEGRLDYKKK